MGCQVGRDTIQLTRMRKHLKPTIFNLQKLSGLAAPSSAVKSNMQTERNRTSFLGLHNREEPLHVGLHHIGSLEKQAF